MAEAKKNPRAFQAANVLRALAEQVEGEIVKSAKVTFDLEDGISVESYYDTGGVVSLKGESSPESETEE